MNFKKNTIGLIALAVTAAGITSASACTAITLTAKDEGVVVGRTMEFGLDVKPSAVVVPAGTELTSSLPAEAKGIKYTSKYGMAGLNFMNKRMLVDGMNEKGVYVGALYLPGYASYPKVEAKTASKSMAPEDYVAWLLANFSSVEEIKKNYTNVILVQNPQKEIGGQSFPGHFIVVDATGASIVIEPVDNTLKLHENPLRVLTNSPTFDWHMTNLENYVNLTAVNVEPLSLSGKKVNGFGQGTGLLGIPGDYTPPSRFVRAVAFSQSAIQLPTATETVGQVFHIMNAFDIPLGAIQEKQGDAIHYDFTQWTSVADLKNMNYYVKTYNNQSLRKIDIKEALKADKKSIKLFDLQTEEQPVEDITAKLK